MTAFCVITTNICSRQRLTILRCLSAPQCPYLCRPQWAPPLHVVTITTPHRVSLHRGVLCVQSSASRLGLFPCVCHRLCSQLAVSVAAHQCSAMCSAHSGGAVLACHDRMTGPHSASQCCLICATDNSFMTGAVCVCFVIFVLDSFCGGHHNLQPLLRFWAAYTMVLHSATVTSCGMAFTTLLHIHCCCYVFQADPWRGELCMMYGCHMCLQVFWQLQVVQGESRWCVALIRRTYMWEVW